MNERREGSLLINGAIAVFASALTSILIISLTHGFSIGDEGEAPERQLASEQAMASGVEGKMARSVADGLVIGDDERVDNRLQIKQLQATVAAAAEERAQLSATIVDLNRQLSDLESNVINLTSVTANNEVALVSSEAVPDVDRAGLAGGFGSETPAERQFESLLAAGLDEQSARDLQLRADQYQLARLELFDQASREGWADSDQLNERLETLDESQPDLRAELGETAYDSYLYESGRPNRVGIASIIAGSAADQAGVQTGDLVFTYADERIYSVNDLQEATRAGSRGEFVTLLVDRNSEILRMDIQRGPMGVTLESIRQAP